MVEAIEDEIKNIGPDENSIVTTKLYDHDHYLLSSSEVRADIIDFLKSNIAEGCYTNG